MWHRTPKQPSKTFKPNLLTLNSSKNRCQEESSLFSCWDKAASKEHRAFLLVRRGCWDSIWVKAAPHIFGRNKELYQQYRWNSACWIITLIFFNGMQRLCQWHFSLSTSAAQNSSVIMPIHSALTVLTKRTRAADSTRLLVKDSRHKAIIWIAKLMSLHSALLQGTCIFSGMEQIPQTWGEDVIQWL